MLVLALHWPCPSQAAAGCLGSRSCGQSTLTRLLGGRGWWQEQRNSWPCSALRASSGLQLDTHG